MRTSFAHSVDDGAQTKSNDFALDSVRLYLNGSVTDHIKFTFDTEYTGSPPAGDNKVQVLDAIGRFEYSDKLNIWAGRFLPPSDRANLYGPYYANNSQPFTDGIQDDYPFVAAGRDNGAAYWGQFGILKVSAGVFDVPGTTGKSEVVSAGRLMVDLWDPEPGYYLNGTYYGEKDILALGVAGQSSGPDHAYSADLLVEKNLADVGTFTLESEYARNSHFGGTVSNHGYYVLAAYLFPRPLGVGKVQVLGKFGSSKYEHVATPYLQHTSEFDLNYLIKAFDARVGLFYLNQARSSGIGDSRAVGVQLQLQM